MNNPFGGCRVVFSFCLLTDASCNGRSDFMWN